MTKALKKLGRKYQAWRERGERKGLKQWERRRSWGKPLFVLWSAAAWGGFMVVFSTLLDYYFDQDLYLEKLPYKAIYYAIAGTIIGFYLWHYNEGKYRKFRT